MIEPSWSWRTRAARLLVAALVGTGAGAGCSVVPQSRLADCHRLSQTLQAENTRLKDSALSLRSQNQDLNQRAVDDARRLRVQDEEIQRLSRSVNAYQEEREQLATAFARLKAQIRTSTSVNPVVSGVSQRLQDLADAHPGWEFDPGRGTLAIPAASWFEAGSDRLRPVARAEVEALATAWNAPDARDVDLLVVGRNDTAETTAEATGDVRRAALSTPGTTGGTLGRDRAARVRDLIAGAARIDAARLEVAGFEVPRAGVSSASAGDQQSRIEIHLRRRGP